MQHCPWQNNCRSLEECCKEIKHKPKAFKVSQCCFEEKTNRKNLWPKLSVVNKHLNVETDFLVRLWCSILQKVIHRLFSYASRDSHSHLNYTHYSHFKLSFFDTLPPVLACVQPIVSCERFFCHIGICLYQCGCVLRSQKYLHAGRRN